MSESTQRKKKPASKSGSSGKKKSSGTKGQSGSSDTPKKRKKKVKSTAPEMSGSQITVDEVIGENENHAGSPKPKRSVSKPDDDDAGITIDPIEENDTDAVISEQANWNQQISSIVFWLLSVILLALTFFPGESAWNVIHNFILGILGSKVILWALLLVYSGYLHARHSNRNRINEIIQYTSALIILADVMGYLMIQSNGYRDVYNELSFGFFQLLGQIYHDGSKLGGTGMLGGFIGESLMYIAGKNGALIITTLLIITVAMLHTHTGPVALFDDTVGKIKIIFDKETYRKLRERYNSEFREEEFTDFEDEGYDDEYPEDDYYDNPEIPEDGNDLAPLPLSGSEAGEEYDEDAAEDSGEEDDEQETGDEAEAAAASPSPARKNTRRSKRDEITAERDEIEKQIDLGSSEGSVPDEMEYRYPPLSLLAAPDRKINSAEEEKMLEETGRTLIAALEEHKIRASISNISPGPTVTRFEITPAQGVRINQITSRSKDIALRLAAKSIRIEAPIPGKAAVGIEIPNKVKQKVSLREIVGSREFREADGALVSALGRDIEGNCVLCDLSEMPHLLIAGSTGSGKSVCINSILISLLYKYSPKEVKMILIDPKSVEFDMYNGIPHLLVPVVCDPKKAAGALQWAVSEMQKRYEMLKERGVRSIENYNRVAERTGEFPKLSRIVIVIDEMADLMATTPKEVEDSISRLAAKARAAGMHIVLATQRPSVEVITGTIKNNVPSRIALAVSANVDSRTILDEGGAEHLIGKGDMLYHPTGSSKKTRVQGCFVDDSEVERVIRFVKKNGTAEYDDSIADEIERNSRGAADEKNPDFDDKDEFFEKAVEIVTEAGQASTSMLQRRLSVGYARAGRIVDQLEEHGIIGPHEGSKPRAVLITRAQWLEMTMSGPQSGNEGAQSSVRGSSDTSLSVSDENPDEFIDQEYDEFDQYTDEDDFSDDDSRYVEDESVEVEVGDPDEDDAEIIVTEPSVPSTRSGALDSGSRNSVGADSLTDARSEQLSTAGRRDFSVFFDDVDQTSYFSEGFDGPDESSDDPEGIPVDDAQESTADDEDYDIPPWEDPSFSFFSVPMRNGGNARSGSREEIPEDDPFAVSGEESEDDPFAVSGEESEDDPFAGSGEESEDDPFAGSGEESEDDPFAGSGDEMEYVPFTVSEMQAEDDPFADSDDDMEYVPFTASRRASGSVPSSGNKNGRAHAGPQDEDDDDDDDILSSPWIKRL